MEIIKNYNWDNVILANIKILLMVAGIFMIIDVITGVINAFIKKQVNSTAIREGIFKKILEAFIIIIGHLFDVILSINAIAAICALFIILQEAVSILENIGDYVKIPKVLKDVIKKLNDNIGEEEESNG